jgi:nucleotide-binding universal stress UspA family protein
MMMKAAVCFDGIDDEALVAAARPFLAHFTDVEAWCAYGAEAEHLAEHVRERHHGPPPPRPHPSLDEEQALSIANHGVALLQRDGIAAKGRTIAGTDAGHAIFSAGDDQTVILLSAGHKGGTGPKSIGHVARFVADHARGPVLLLRTARG